MPHRQSEEDANLLLWPNTALTLIHTPTRQKQSRQPPQAETYRAQDVLGNPCVPLKHGSSRWDPRRMSSIQASAPPRSTSPALEFSFTFLSSLLHHTCPPLVLLLLQLPVPLFQLLLESLSLLLWGQVTEIFGDHRLEGETRAEFGICNPKFPKRLSRS